MAKEKKITLDRLTQMVARGFEKTATKDSLDLVVKKN